MAKFNYKKWITENKYGKLNEQGTADFKVKEQTSGSAGSGSAGSGSTGGNTGSGSTGGNTGSGSTGGSTGSGSTGGSTGSGSTGGSINKSADLDKDGKLSSYEKVRGAAIEKNMRKYKAGRTQGNGNPLLPEQIFGMQHSSKPPKQETIAEMNSYYENMGCEGIQKMYAEYYYSNKKLMTKENGTGPYEYSNVMQEGDNPEQQGSLVSNMNYLSELAPSGCNEMAKIQEINGNFNLHENKITKRTSKRAIKNIIKEELKKALLKEQNEQYNGEGCVTLQNPLGEECHDCQGNSPGYTGTHAYLTGPNCECCKEDTTRGSDDPCLDPTNPEQPNCWYCKSNDCQQTGTMPYMTNTIAAAAGFSLYLNKALCNNSEAACGEQRLEEIECMKCDNGFPVGNMFPGPSCPQGWVLGSLFDPKKCKKPLPTGGNRLPVEPALGESRRLRKEIQKELFGKKNK